MASLKLIGHQSSQVMTNVSELLQDREVNRVEEFSVRKPQVGKRLVL